MMKDREQKQSIKSDNLVIRTSKETVFDSRWSEVKINGKNILNRSSHVSTFIDTKMFVHGGYDADKGILSDFYYVDLSQDSEDFTWVQLSNSIDEEPIKLKGHIAVSYKGQVVMFGGEKNIGENNREVFIYNSLNHSWKKAKITGKLNAPKVESHCGTLIGDNLYIYGGYIADQATFMRNIYVLNLEKMEWSLIYESNGTNEPEGRSNSAMVAQGESLYIFGGTNGEKTLDDMWKFDTRLKRWEKIEGENGPEARRGHSMVTYKEYIFLFGGIQDVTKEKNDIYIFEFSQKKWNKIHTFTNSVYDCSPTLKKEKRETKSPDRFTIQRLSPEKSTQNSDVMRKILAENKQKKFMEKKKELLKQFNEKPEEAHKQRSFSPTTESMLKTLESIGNQETNKNDQRHEIIYDESGRFIIGKKPCARDGHTLAVSGNKMYIFGGDRHLMSFNDLYEFDLDKGLKSLELYRNK